MKKILSFLSIIFIIQCSNNENDCNECGGGLLDGYLYKQVAIEDISDLTAINISAEIGECIRFKMIEGKFSDAKIVNDCCCVQYE
tara:strand:+ start:441 stop:695 length:255 start_codon:yes stop_codon:yes gene_type:complete